MNSPSSTREVLYSIRPEGRVAYEVAGAGPLIVCVPGMGDLRGSYRFLAPELVAAGYRVVITDLRGHGDSDAGFSEYGDEATAADVAGLINELGGPAIIVANSMAAGSAALIAVDHPELVGGLALVGPFVRGPVASGMARLMTRIAMAPLWAAASWKAYLPKLYAGTKPADFSQYQTAVAASMRRPGYAKAFSLTTRTRHDAAAAALPRVSVPALIVMGELDPDFPDAAAEARWVADQLNGEALMVAEAGHYPQSQRPDLVGPAVTAFIHRVIADAS